MPKLKAVHPGEILMEEFLKPFEISQYRLAKDIHVPAIRISQIVNARRAISADTALRLGKYFGNSAQFWLNLQNHYDLQIQSEKLEQELKIEVKALALNKSVI
ncbi:HigA family addiction module antidote protein [Candidatus Peregrinibacteria bacterium]|nr:HigA family addiction module antidote protein [Candidatus Peregrinibacteria bacterium]